MHVGNSYSRLEGLTRAQLNEIRDLTSYKKMDYNSKSLMYQYKALVKRYGIKPNLNQRKHLKIMRRQYQAAMRPTYLVDKRGSFPSGLLPRVKQWLKSHRFELIDKRRVPEPLLGRFTLDMRVTPYELQTNAVAACSGADRGIISACTGFGKSLMIAMLVQQMQLKTLIVVPTVGLKEQLRESFKAWFGDTGGQVVIENIDSTKLKQLTDFDLLIIDEAHHAAANTYRKLNKSVWSEIYYRFCFTATPFRSRTEETILMESITSKVLFEITYQDALKTGAVVPVEAYYVELPKTEVDGYTWAQVYSELVVKNAVRNEAIIGLMVSLHGLNISTLCLVKEIAHGNTLSCDGAFAFANGKDTDANDWIGLFNDKRISGLIATTGVCGEGRDTKPCEYVIIAGLGKSKPAFMQMIGRSLRRYPGKVSAKVIIFKDKSHKWTLSHFKAQCAVLSEEYGVTPVKLTL